MLRALIAAFDAAPKPVLLKCSGEPGLVEFRRRALHPAPQRLGRVQDEASAQFAAWPYLHRPKKFQFWLKPFLTFARQSAAWQTARTMGCGGQHAGSFESAWLEANGLAGSFLRPLRSALSRSGFLIVQRLAIPGRRVRLSRRARYRGASRARDGCLRARGARCRSIARVCLAPASRSAWRKPISRSARLDLGRDGLSLWAAPSGDG